MKKPTITELRDGYAMVAMFGRLESAAEALAEQRAVAAKLASRGDRRVLFDNRGTLAPDESIRDLMFDWVASFERAALLLDSEMAAVRANMWALSKRAAVRAFHDEATAVKWLLR